MKRKIITLVLAMAAASLISTTAMAADETVSGFYDIGTAQNVTITPYSGTTQVTATEKNIDSDDAAEQVYIDADRIEVSFGTATVNEHYGIILVEGVGLPTKDTKIYYINQETAASSSVDFNVFPLIPAETKEMTLYISSSEEGADLVSVPVSYAVNATVVPDAPSYKLGDPDDNGEIDVKDVIVIRQHVAGGYGVTIIEAAANVNKDEVVDVKDVIMLRQFIAGGYGVELE